MKKLYLVGGTMGVGKTTTCRLLRDRLDRSVFLDGDWCWDMRPFVVNAETKTMVMDNICHLLNNFLRCTAYDSIVFCWVMHEQGIIDELLSQLDLGDCRVYPVSLVCTPEALRARLQRDVDAALRQPDIVERSCARLPLYAELHTYKLDVSALTPDGAAEALSHLDFLKEKC